MIKIARVVNNNNGYTQISGIAEYGTLTPNNNAHFGFEEWNNAPFIQKEKVGYLNCYSQGVINDEHDIYLIARTNHPQAPALYKPIGIFKKVRQLINNQIGAYQNIINANLATIQKGFNPIDPTIIAGNVAHPYSNHLNSNNLIRQAPNPNHFLLNFCYFEFEEAPKISEIEIIKFTTAIQQTYIQYTWHIDTLYNHIEGQWQNYFL